MYLDPVVALQSQCISDIRSLKSHLVTDSMEGINHLWIPVDINSQYSVK